MSFKMRCQPRFDYAQAKHTVSGNANEVIFSCEDVPETSFRLLSSVPLQIEGENVVADFTLCEKQKAHFVIQALTVEENRSIEECIAYYTGNSFYDM